MSIQDTLFLIGWYLFCALVIAATIMVLWSILPGKIKSLCEAMINPLTMRLGVWLIGDRETAREKEIKALKDLLIGEWEQASTSHRKNTDIKREQLAVAIRERAEAIEAGIDAMQDRNAWESAALIYKKERDAMAKRHAALFKRYNTLRDRTISKTPKRKAKAKTKR